MKRMVVSILALTAVFSIFAGPVARAQDKKAQDDKSQNENKPEIFLPELRYDFGKVFEQEKYEHDFVVKNRGKADLVIDRVKPG